jgi:xylan 1,4-beta-xylosidase
MKTVVSFFRCQFKASSNFTALFAFAVCMFSGSNVKAVNITIDGSIKQGTVPHYWENCVGRSTFRHIWRPLWDTAAEIGAREAGFKTVRGHGMLMGWDGLDSVGMFHWSGNIADSPTYNWKIFDSCITILHKCGLEPVMELDFMPKDLQSNGPLGPPKNYTVWQNFMTELGKHCIDKFGTERVRSWYWELWNEPDLGMFWSGKWPDDYYSLYKATAFGLKAADPQLKVGGPSTTGYSALQTFVNYCSTNNIPLDFISNHNYAAGPGNGSDPTVIRTDNRARVDVIKNSGKKLLGFNTEYSSTYAGQGGGGAQGTATTPNVVSMDSHVNAPFVAKCIKLILDDYTAGTYALPEILSYWAISDVFDECPPNNGGSFIESHNFVPFGQVFGLITYHGLRKATFNAYKMLHMMGTSRISFAGGSGDADGIDGFATINKDSSQVAILVYNYFKTFTGNLNQNLVNLSIKNLPFSNEQSVEVTHYRVDSLHSNPYSMWLKQGKPVTPTAIQWDSLKAAQNLALIKPTRVISYNRVETLTDTFTMPPQSLSLIVFSKIGASSVVRNVINDQSTITIHGSSIKAKGFRNTLIIEVFSLNGQLLKRIQTPQDNIDLRKYMPHGTFIVSVQSFENNITQMMVIGK